MQSDRSEKPLSHPLSYLPAQPQFWPGLPNAFFFLPMLHLSCGLWDIVL